MKNFFKKEINFSAGHFSFLANQSEFQGELLFDDFLRVDNRFSGKIIAKSLKDSVLFIDKNADVKADIVADNVIIAGNFLGKIFSSQCIEIKKNARFEGMVFTVDLEVSPHSYFQGQSFMMEHLSLEQRKQLKIDFQQKNFLQDTSLLEDFQKTYLKLK